MRSGYVEIVRHFRVTDAAVPPTFERRLLRGLQSSALTWTSLVNPAHGGATVLLAASGTGKTTEFREQAASGRRRGLAAIYCEASAVVETGLEQSLEPSDLEVFRSWREGTSAAVIFVDAIDELYLHQRSLRDLTRRLAKELDPGTRPAQLFLSTRNGAWSPEDTAYVTALLVRGGDQSRVRFVTFEPIDRSAIRALALAAGVTDATEFLRAYDEDEIDALVPLRPTDVRLLAEAWKRTREFGRWRDVLSGLISASVDEENRAHELRQSLPPSDARRALERIGAATVLMRKLHVGLPKAPAGDSAIRSRRLFDDWTWSKLTEVFENPLLVHKGLDAVQLPEGPLTHHLAARWFAQRAVKGWTVEQIRNALFVRIFEESEFRLPDLRRALAGWVASEVPEFRKVLLESHPDVLLYEGDPSQLADADIRAALTESLKRVVPPMRMPWVTNATIRLLARPAVEATVRQLLVTYRKSDDVQLHLLFFAREGRYRSCVAEARRLAHDVTAHDVVRAAAIGVVGRCGDRGEQKALLQLTRTASPAVRAALLEVLVPDFLTGSPLVAFLSSGGRRELESALSRVADRISPSDIDAIISAIHPHLASGAESSATKRRFSIAIPLLIARLRAGGAYPAVTIGALAAVERLSEMAFFLADEDRTALLSALRADNSARRALWAARIQAAVVDDSAFTHLSNPRFGDLEDDDLVWLFEYGANSTASVNEMVLQAIQDRYHRLSRQAQQALVARPGLPAALAERLTDLDAIRLKADLAREASELKARTKIAETRRGNEAAIASRRASIETGEDLRALEWAVHHLGEPETRSGRIDVAKLRTLVGEDLVVALIRGFKASWRKLDVAVPIPGAIATPLMYRVGLSGIMLEVIDGLEVSTLSPGEARLATRLAMYELNAFPVWFEELAVSHAAPVRAALRELIELEWNAAILHHGVMRFAPYESRAVGEMIRQIVLELLEKSPPGHVRTVHYAVDAILLATSGAERVEEHVASQVAAANDDETLCEWLRAWAHFAPVTAARWLEAVARQDKPRFVLLTERTAALLEMDFDGRLGRTGTTALMAAPGVEHWVRLLHRALGPGAGGTHRKAFSPGSRDRAVEFKSRCLQRLANDPSREANSAIWRLKTSNLLKSERSLLERILAQQLMSATEAACPGWTEDDVLVVERGDERRPANTQELFGFLRSHIADVGALVENSDFSYRKLFTAATKEREIQLWAASCLRQRSRGLYSVVRENVVDRNKEPDISAIVDGVGQVPIEIKPLGNKRAAYSASALRGVIDQQLLGRYMQPSERRFGVLLLVRVDRRCWTIGGRRVGLPALLDDLRSHARRVGLAHGKVIAIEVIDLMEPTVAKVERRPATRSKQIKPKRRRARDTVAR